MKRTAIQKIHRLGFFRPFVFYRIGKTNYLVMGADTFLVPETDAKEIAKFALFSMNLDRMTDRDLKNLPAFLKFLEKASSNNWLKVPTSNQTSFAQSEALEAVQNAVSNWKYGIQNPELNRLLAKNKSAQAAYLVEIAYYVSQASIYLSAACKSSTGKLRKIFQCWLADEAPHYKSLLTDISVSESELSGHDGCHSTHALIAYLHYLAIRRPTSLAVCMALLEADDVIKESTLEHYRDIGRKLNISAKNYEKHFLGDLHAGHGELWKDALLLKKSYTYLELSSILTDVHTTRHLIIQWLDGLQFRLQLAASYGAHLKKPKPRHFIRSMIRPESLIAEKSE